MHTRCGQPALQLTTPADPGDSLGPFSDSPYVRLLEDFGETCQNASVIYAVFIFTCCCLLEN